MDTLNAQFTDEQISKIADALQKPFPVEDSVDPALVAIEQSLKPCPFCGSKAIESEEITDDFVLVRCEDCGAGVDSEDGEKTATEKWNRRAS